MNLRNTRKKNKGFTFPDLVIGLMIIAVIAVAGLQVNSLSGKMQKDQQGRLQAIYIALSQIEDLKKFSDQYGVLQPELDTAGNPHPATDAIILPAGYTLSYTVTDRRWDEATRPVNPQWPFHYKEIDATCGHGQQTVHLKGYVYKVK